MAFFIRAIKTWRVTQKWEDYKAEKEYALALSENESEYESSNESFSTRISSSLEYFSFWWFIRRFRVPHLIAREVLKSVIGFFGGVILVYIFFFFNYVGVHFSLVSSSFLCGALTPALCLGLALSSKVRCYVLLLLPVFFSKQGRQALLAYALFLAFTGPAKNTMHNIEILSESMTCGQEMVRKTLKQVMEMIRTPHRSTQETMQKIIASLREIIDSMTNFVLKIKRLIVSTLSVVKKGTSWLKNIAKLCNLKIGTPFQRCMKTFDDAITDCKAKLGVLDFLCHVVHTIHALCYTVKCFDYLCFTEEFVSDKVFGAVKKKLRKFGNRLRNIFYVSIEFSHHYEFETKCFNNTKEPTKTILQILSKKVESVQNIFSLFGFMFSFFFVFVVLKVYYYKFNYLCSDRFDNIYISKYTVELDEKRAVVDKETVLPLEPREKRKYAKPTAFRLLSTEKSRISESMFLLSLTTFKILTFLVIDYGLFWLLLTIYQAGKDVVQESEKSKIELHIQGSGFLANFYRNLGKTLEVPPNPNLHLTPLHCLPEPTEPDKGRYIQIGFLVGLSWFLTMTEPYGLRLRNIVMSYYYPDRARERAVWLYNQILLSRGSFIRYARRQLRKSFRGRIGKPVERITLIQRLFASFPILGGLFGRKEENSCLFCNEKETESGPLRKCKTPDCPGRHCPNCFRNLDFICSICLHPFVYGDHSDMSEEVDSSEDEFGIEGNCSREDFKLQMEHRDRFRDVEANKMLDYARLSDLYDKKTLKRRIREVLLKRLRTLEKRRRRKEELKQLKYKLQNLITRLRKKKTEADAEKENDEEVKPVKSRVSFYIEDEKNLPLSPPSKSMEEIKKLKENLREKIRSLKRKNISRLTSTVSKSVQSVFEGRSAKGRSTSSDDSGGA